MGSITVTLSGIPKDLVAVGAARDMPREIARNVDALLWQIIQGALANANPKLFVSYSASDAVQAAGTLTISSGSGSVGGTIDGTAKTVTWATSDTASAAALAAAINADATLSKKVYATSAAGVVTVTAIVPGIQGNAITLVASGTGVTASGAKLGAGTGTAGVGADTYVIPATNNL